MREVKSARVVVACTLAALLSICIVTGARAAERIARVASESMIGGQTPEAHQGRQKQLHAWLMSELPDGALDAPIRAPLTKRDRDAIANDDTLFPRPLRVGIVKRVGRTIKFWGAGSSSNVPTHGAFRMADDGGFS